MINAKKICVFFLSSFLINLPLKSEAQNIFESNFVVTGTVTSDASSQGIWHSEELDLTESISLSPGDSFIANVSLKNPINLIDFYQEDESIYFYVNGTNSLGERFTVIARRSWYRNLGLNRNIGDGELKIINLPNSIKNRYNNNGLDYELLLTGVRGGDLSNKTISGNAGWMPRTGDVNLIENIDLTEGGVINLQNLELKLTNVHPSNTWSFNSLSLTIGASQIESEQIPTERVSQGQAVPELFSIIGSATAVGWGFLLTKKGKATLPYLW